MLLNDVGVAEQHNCNNYRKRDIKRDREDESVTGGSENTCCKKSYSGKVPCTLLVLHIIISQGLASIKRKHFKFLCLTSGKMRGRKWRESGNDTWEEVGLSLA